MTGDRRMGGREEREEGDRRLKRVSVNEKHVAGVSLRCWTGMMERSSQMEHVQVLVGILNGM